MNEKKIFGEIRTPKEKVEITEGGANPPEQIGSRPEPTPPPPSEEKTEKT